ncbi:MAG: TonB-dependent receptor [Magnetococcales bacterium]|nr:TonB-dependent receptor [Magnetococcales bacterium]NGZ25766.1 TonB-dependent receptor [Magnetococcales bacterium]
MTGQHWNSPPEKMVATAEPKKGGFIHKMSVFPYQKYLYLPVIFGVLLLPLCAQAGQRPAMSSAPLENPSSLPTDEPTEQGKLTDLLQILEESTEIATKTKLNVDFVPGMVTILTGDDLKSRGVNTVQEALNLVPGFTTSMAGPMKEQVTVRGVSKQLSGKIKFLINGMQANDTSMGEPFYIYAIPMDLIDRIEVIRGPGSAVYGEFAYLGVVNIITKTKGNRIIGQYGSFGAVMGGGVFSYTPPKEQYGFSLAMSGWQSDGGHVRSGLDRDLSGAPFNSPANSHLYAPGKVNEGISHRSAFLSAYHKDTSLVAQYIARGDGERFGHNDVLPPEEDRLSLHSATWLVEGRQNFQFGKEWQTTFKLGLFRDRFDMDRAFMWPVGMAPLPNTISKYVNEDRYYGSGGMVYRGWERHTISSEVQYSDSSAWDSSGTSLGRSIFGFSLQDQISLLEPLDVTIGLRYDDYNQIGTTLMPRIAAVYRLSNNHIFKAQYGEAFRPPSYMELNPNAQPVNGTPGNKPETIQTLEAGYIYRDHERVGRITLFHSELDDVIDLVVTGGGARKYMNTQNIRLHGIELELEAKLSKQWKVDSNISYVDTKDVASKQDLAGATDWLFNMGLAYAPQDDLLFSLQFRHVDSRYREPGDTRLELGGINTLDVTANVMNLFLPGLTLRSGIKNILDASVVYPALMNTYPNDYPRPGRSWWMNLSYDF